jgi:hypothetical protein
MMCRLHLLTAELKLQLLKNVGCGSFSVIKIVKMKYKRNNWYQIVTFKIHLDILPALYVKHTIFFIKIQIFWRVYFYLFHLKAFIKQNHTVYM